MGASNVIWVRLGEYIEQCDERNSASFNYPVIGINRDKTFMPTVANLDGVDIAKYKIVTKGMFVFSRMQTGFRHICYPCGSLKTRQPPDFLYIPMDHWLQYQERVTPILPLHKPYGVHSIAYQCCD